MPNGVRRALLELRDVTKYYSARRSFVNELLGRGAHAIKAVDGLTLAVEEGEILGIAGESGCGKTVTGEMLVGLQRPTSGAITYRGRDIFALRGVDRRMFRRQAQMIFQDPYETLNPRFTVYRTLADPLDVHGLRRGPERRRYLTEVLEECGLKPGARYLDRYPFLLSGGERQRVAVARALVLEPAYLVADEPTSMLDVSIRAGVLDLLRTLNRNRRLTVVFISHDLAAMRELADRIAVMYLGRVIEAGPAEALLRDPRHPYTRGLIAALPRIDGRGDDRGYVLRGDIPDPTAIPSGCRFAPRCEVREPRCVTEPELRLLAQGRSVACHRADVEARPWSVAPEQGQTPRLMRDGHREWPPAGSCPALSNIPV